MDISTKIYPLQTMPPEVIQHSTLLASWVVVLFRLLEFRGLNARQVFVEAGIDLQSLQHPGARIPHSKITKVWLYLQKSTNDKTVGLDAGRVIYPGMYHFLSTAMFAAPNLMTVMEYLAKYRRIFHPLSRVGLSVKGEQCWLTWGALEPYVSPVGSEAVIASMMSLCRQLSNPKFSPLQVKVKGQLSEQERAKYEQFYCAPVSLGEDQHALVFDKAQLEQPLLTANPGVELFSLAETKKYVASLDDKEIINTVYCKIVELLPSRSCSIEAIADDLMMSLRTLQRRLSEAETNFDALLQSVREELAIGYINNKNLSIKEVSYMLGFSRATNFSRAFKRWTGLSPVEYREGIR